MSARPVFIAALGVTVMLLWGLYLLPGAALVGTAVWLEV